MGSKASQMRRRHRDRRGGDQRRRTTSRNLRRRRPTARNRKSFSAPCLNRRVDLHIAVEPRCPSAAHGARPTALFARGRRRFVTHTPTPRRHRHRPSACTGDARSRAAYYKVDQRHAGQGGRERRHRRPRTAPTPTCKPVEAWAVNGSWTPPALPSWLSTSPSPLKGTV